MTEVAGVLQVAGAAFVLLAGIGLLRLPDALTRASAVSKAAVLGVGLILLGVVVAEPSLRTAALVLAVLVLHVLTVPLSGLAIGRSAYLSGAVQAPLTRLDEPRDLQRRDADGPS